jgi:glycosyltransferase involved in cell wall biosynthesis
MVKPIAAAVLAGFGNKTNTMSELVLPVRVALLTTFIAPYSLPIWRALSRLVAEFHVFISTEMESNRDWDVYWDDLNLRVQKTITFVRSEKHCLGFANKRYLHFPYDTIHCLRRCGPDVVISSELGLRTIQSTLFRALTPRTGLVCWADLSEHTEHGIGLGKRVLRQSLLRYADATIVNGESGARYVMALGAAPERIIRMPYVLDMKSLLTIPLSRDAYASRRLLYVGQLMERKGVHLLLEALARRRRLHPNEPCELWIAGDGPMRKQFESFAQANALSVRFLGSVPFSELRSVYASVGIFVFPTLSDTWGVVVNEALAAGLPVLGSNLSQAVDELVREGYNGWRFRPDRSEEFDVILERALGTSADALDKMREAARLSIRELTPEYAADQVVMAVKLAHDAAMARVGRKLSSNPVHITKSNER